AEGDPVNFDIRDKGLELGFRLTRDGDPFEEQSVSFIELASQMLRGVVVGGVRIFDLVFPFFVEVCADEVGEFFISSCYVSMSCGSNDFGFWGVGLKVDFLSW